MRFARFMLSFPGRGDIARHREFDRPPEQRDVVVAEAGHLDSQASSKFRFLRRVEFDRDRSRSARIEP